MNAPQISVIIPTHNRRDWVLKALDSLCRQTLTPDRFEVIVVADGCNDGTETCLRERSWPFALKVLSQPSGGAGAARNLGAAAAQTSLLAFMDDDIDPAPQWLEGHRSAHQGRPRLVSVGYLAVPSEPREDFFQIELRYWWEAMFFPLRDPAHRFSYTNLTSGNFSIDRELFQEVGGFRTDMVCHEDYELGYRLIQHGADFLFNQVAWGWHNDRSRLDRAVERKYEEGVADVSIGSWYPELIPNLLASRLFQVSLFLTLIFLAPPLARLLASLARRVLEFLETIRARSMWRRVLHGFLAYGYGLGLKSQLGSYKALRAFVRPRPREQDAPSVAPLDLDVERGIEAASLRLDKARPSAVRLFYGDAFLGTVPPEPGSEPVQGKHLKGILVAQFPDEIRSELMKNAGLTDSLRLPETSLEQPGPRERLLIFSWLAVATTTLVYYYRQVLGVFRLGPIDWLRDNYSFHFLGFLLRLVRGEESLALPYAQTALLREAIAIVACLSVVLAAIVLGSALLSVMRWRIVSRAEKLLFSYGLGAGSLAFLSLALAYADRYTIPAVRLMILGILAGGAIWVIVRLNRSRGFNIRVWLRRLEPPRPAGWDRVWLAIILLALAMTLVGALAPEVGYDAVWYHLWLPKLWLQAGHPVDPIQEYISLYPLNQELLYGAGLAMGGPVAAKLLHYATLPMLALLMMRATRRYFPGASPYLAAVLFVTAPTILWEATTANVDLAVTLMTGLAFYAIARYLETWRRSWLVLSALIFGFALGIKHLALLLLPLFVATLAISMWWRSRSWYKVVRAVVAVSTLALLLGSPWYIRNFVASGNPVFPDFYRVFGAQPPERWNAMTQAGYMAFESHFGRPHTLLNTLSLPFDVLFHSHRYDGDFGPVLALALLGLAFLRRWRWTTIAALAISGLYFAYWGSPYGYFELRFLIPILPFVALLAVEGCSRLLGAVGRNLSPNWTKVLTGALALLVCLNLPPFTSIHEGDRVVWDNWLTSVIDDLPIGVVVGAQSPDDYIAANVPAYPAWQEINATLPEKGTKILAFNGGDQLYSERDRLWIDATMAQPILFSAGPDQAQPTLTALKKLGITHILEDKTLAASPGYNSLELLQAEFTAKYLAKVYEDENSLVFQVRYANDP